MRSDHRPLRETELYGPLRDYLEAQGYSVRSEVRGCDVVAERDGEIIVLELKRSLSVSLLVQAADRQRAFSSVYVVLPHPGARARSRAWRSACRLLKRMELGLVLVDLGAVDGRGSGSPGEVQDRKPSVEAVFHPLPAPKRSRKDVRRAVLTELHGRSIDLNEGGSTRRSIVTAYRENAVQIACCLAVNGPSSPSALRNWGTGRKTPSILSSNFYGWFERVARGVYALTEKGREELQEYPALVERYMRGAKDAASLREDA
jgi:hypothetical protein